MLEIATSYQLSFYIYRHSYSYINYVLIGFKLGFQSSILNCFLSAKNSLTDFDWKQFVPQVAGANKSIVL